MLFKELLNFYDFKKRLSFSALEKGLLCLRRAFLSDFVVGISFEL